MADRVVFVSHEASRTGAPISLLVLVRWLRAHSDLDLDVVVLEPGVDGGLLLDELRDAVPTHLAEEPSAWRPLVAAGDVVFLNSVFGATCLEDLGEGRPYVISRVPELSMSFRHWLRPPDRQRLLDRTDRFIAVSDAVRQVLVEEQGVADDRVVVLPGTIEPVEVDVSPAQVRAELGLPVAAPVVGAVGTTEWRKGPDLFVDLVRRLDGVHAIWVGSPEGGPPFWEAERGHGVDGDRLRFVPSVADPRRYYAAMDVFALTSREDPFPRVCLEAAAAGVPFVTFESGGAAELARQGCGEVVDYLDVEAMAERVRALLDDPGRRRVLGEAGARLVASEYTIDAVGPKVLAEIEHGLRRT